MSQVDTLKHLEGVLQSFLERVVELKGDRLQVLDGINSLDDIALSSQMGKDMSDEVGDWFADHGTWLSDDRLRSSDQGRIGRILEEIQGDMEHTDNSTAALDKIRNEIERWREATGNGNQKLVMRRGPETVTSGTRSTDSIALFDNTLGAIRSIFAGLSGQKLHLLSVLDETLKKAQMQNDKEALILSGLIIYYLKLESYKVEPYVKRLKEAERQIKGVHDA